ncbi:hypothetical protein [Geoglobus sp.]
MLSGNMLKVLQLLADKTLDIESLRKSTRLPEKMLKSLVESLVERGYVESGEEGITITEKGREALKKTQL